MKPRTVCRCQPSADIRLERSTPLGRCSQAMAWDFLELPAHLQYSNEVRAAKAEADRAAAEAAPAEKPALLGGAMHHLTERLRVDPARLPDDAGAFGPRVRWIAKEDSIAQASFIAELFGIAA
jgi:hypothetical protein